MSEPTQGSQWDTLMSVLIEGKRYINWEDKFENEIKTIEWLNENPNVRLVHIQNQYIFFIIYNRKFLRLHFFSSILSEWLSRLNDSKPRSTEVSAKYRNEGNILFNNKNVCDEDVVAELYTQAIFSAPENTEELALAHANRAAIFMKSFYEEVIHFVKNIFFLYQNYFHFCMCFSRRRIMIVKWPLNLNIRKINCTNFYKENFRQQFN